MTSSSRIKTAKSAVTSLFLSLILGLSLLTFTPPAQAAVVSDVAVSKEDGLKIHPGMRPPRVHRLLKTEPFYADSVTRKGKRYWVEVYLSYGREEFGVIYRIRDSGRTVVMTAWENLVR